MVHTEDLFVIDRTKGNDGPLKLGQINHAISENYGKPTSIEEKWTNDLYEKDSTKKELAIRLGHVNLISHWETKSTYITSALQSDKNGMTLSADYFSRMSPEELKVQRSKK